MSIRLSVSSADCWQACNRKWYFKYRAQREPIGKPVELLFGSAWHAHREGKPATFGLEGVELTRLTVLNEAYEKHYANSPLEILAHEEAFDLPGFDGTGLDDGVRVHGRIDGRSSGALVEFKTTSSYIDAGSMYWERVLDDRQIQTYLGALWSAGHTYSTVVYDVARKPMIKRKPKESLEDYAGRLREAIAVDPEAYFQRREFNFTTEQVADTWRDLHSVAMQIPDSTELKDYPRAPRSCTAYGRACEYQPVCRGETTIDDDRLYQVRKVS